METSVQINSRPRYTRLLRPRFEKRYRLDNFSPDFAERREKLARIACAYVCMCTCGFDQRWHKFTFRSSRIEQAARDLMCRLKNGIFRGEISGESHQLEQRRQKRFFFPSPSFFFFLSSFLSFFPFVSSIRVFKKKKRKRTPQKAKGVDRQGRRSAIAIKSASFEKYFLLKRGNNFLLRKFFNSP